MLNNMFIVIFEEFIVVVLSCYLNKEGRVLITTSDRISNGASYVFGFVCFVVIPVCLLFMFFQKPKTLKSKIAIKTYGSFYEGLNCDSKFSLFFNFLFLIRRLGFLYIVFNERL